MDDVDLRDNSRVGAGRVETWSLDHPQLGRFEAHIGSVDQLRAIDPDFPTQAAVLASLEEVEDPDASDDEDDHHAADAADNSEDEREAAERLAELQTKGERLTRRLEKRLGPQRTERLRTWAHRDENWRSRALLVTRKGSPIVRLGSLKNAKVSLRQHMPAGKLTQETEVGSGPRVVIEVAPPGRFVSNILIRRDDEVVALEPPAGSPAAARFAEMEASPWKRIAYPLVGGLGKAGWALTILFLGPLFSRILEPIIEFIARLLAPPIQWLLDLIPDVDIPWPHITWPSIDLPDIPWPRINLPDIPWPDWTPPGWLVWLAEHPKTWTPVLIALGLGVLAARNNKKSQATKAEWERKKRERELARLAGDLRALRDTRRK